MNLALPMNIHIIWPKYFLLQRPIYPIIDDSTVKFISHCISAIYLQPISPREHDALMHILLLFNNS